MFLGRFATPFLGFCLQVNSALVRHRLPIITTTSLGLSFVPSSWSLSLSTSLHSRTIFHARLCSSTTWLTDCDGSRIKVQKRRRTSRSEKAPEARMVRKVSACSSDKRNDLTELVRPSHKEIVNYRRARKRRNIRKTTPGSDFVEESCSSPPSPSDECPRSPTTSLHSESAETDRGEAPLWRAATRCVREIYCTHADSQVNQAGDIWVHSNIPIPSHRGRAAPRPRCGPSGRRLHILEVVYSGVYTR